MIYTFLNSLYNLSEWVNNSIFANLSLFIYQRTGFYIQPMPVFVISIIVLLFGSSFLVKIGLFLHRRRLKGTPSTGRFATEKEIKKKFILPSKHNLFIAKIFSGLLVVIIFLYIFSINPFSAGLLFLLILGGIAYFLGNLFWIKFDLSALKKRSMPYLLGYFGSKEIHLFGGKVWRLFYGFTKPLRTEHVLIIGPTGAGKTTAYFIPQLIDDAFGNCSIFLVEAKTTDEENLYKQIAPIWRAQGKKIVVFDPWSSDGPSVSFNPLFPLKADFSDIHTRDAIDQIVDAIYRTTFESEGTASADAMHFIGQEQNLMKYLMYVTLFRRDSQRNLPTIHEVVSGPPSKCIAYINSTISVGNKDLARDIDERLSWFTSVEDSMRMDRKAELLTGIGRKIQIFSHPGVKKYSIMNELDLDSFFKEPTLLVIKSPTNLPGANTISSIITRLLMIKAGNKQKLNKNKDFKVWFYLDELPSLCIPNLPQFAATVRSLGVGIVTAVQDKADLFTSVRARTGQSAESLFSNLKTKIILPGLQFETAQYFSKSFGMTEVATRESNREAFDIFTFRIREVKQSAPLITPDAIQYMEEDEVLIANSNTRPFMLKTKKWFEVPYYRGLIEKYKTDESPVPDKLLCDQLSYEGFPDFRANLVSSDKVGKENDKNKEVPGNSFKDETLARRSEDISVPKPYDNNDNDCDDPHTNDSINNAPPSSIGVDLLGHDHHNNNDNDHNND